MAKQAEDLHLPEAQLARRRKVPRRLHQAYNDEALDGLNVALKSLSDCWHAQLSKAKFLHKSTTNFYSGDDFKMAD